MNNVMGITDLSVNMMCIIAVGYLNYMGIRAWLPSIKYLFAIFVFEEQINLSQYTLKKIINNWGIKGYFINDKRKLKILLMYLLKKKYLLIIKIKLNLH